ncbi:MAG: hypothetical protein LWX56_06095 [Ignavibacteria bacterium]|nr:hypothetical protein [Ignavibacteria bacterium]
MLKNQLRHLLLLPILFTMCLFISSCDKDVSITQPEPAKPDRRLVIRSKPKYCFIFVNNRNSGYFTPDTMQVPDTLIRLDETDTLITLKYQYYRDSVFTVHIPAETTKELYIDFYANPAMRGNFYCTAKPTNCTILLNDSSINAKTPFTIKNLLPGKYNITYQAYSHRDLKQTFIIRSSQTTNVFMAPEDTTVWLSYTHENSPLPDNSLYSVCVDKKDVKWFGTASTGLVRFDEKSWKIYNMSNSNIPSNRINCITTDAQNNIWIGTDFGLAKFDGTNFTTYRTSNAPLPDDWVSSITFDQNGIMWVGTYRGVTRFNGSTWKTIFSSTTAVPSVWVTGIAIGTQNDVYMATRTDLVRYWNNQIIRYGYTMDTTFSVSTALNAVAVGPDDVVWCGALSANGLFGGIFSFDGYFWKSDYTGLPNNNMNCIYINKKNEKFVGTDNGLVRFTNYFLDRLIYYKDNTNLKSNVIRGISKDSNEIYWIVTGGGGVTKYKSKNG